VVTGYGPELISWDMFHTMYQDKLRLVSIFGRDNGSFTYARGTYCDYSGGDKKFVPFNNYEDAFELFKSEVLKRGINDSTIVLAKKHNIIFPEVDIAAFREAKTKVLLSNIETYKKSIDTWEAAIQKFNDNPLSL
jgi:hypothetical protein